MKIIALGDTHGRKLWKEIVTKEQDADKIIFIGDYFDSRDGSSAIEQIDNFKDILQFQKDYPEKVVLLLGNHDFHYLKDAQEKYSGFQQFKFVDINEVLEPAVQSGRVIACYQHENFLFTHAGVTKTWCDDNEIETENIVESINQALLIKPSVFRFSIGNNFDQSGDDVTQSPIWVRIPSLMKDNFKGFIYVVGHSTLKELTITERLIGIDTLGTTGEYLSIIDGIPSAKK